MDDIILSGSYLISSFSGEIDVIISISSIISNELVVDGDICTKSILGHIFYYDISKITPGNYVVCMTNSQEVKYGIFNI